MDDYTPPAGYTPTTEEVKDDFLNMGALRGDENAETLDRWYRWLAEHDRVVAANAWDEAKADNKGWRCVCIGKEHMKKFPAWHGYNPYRVYGTGDDRV